MWLGYLAAIGIGLLLGLIGGGGSILTVPVFVYLLHVDPMLATTYSLFVVGISSLVGGVKAYNKSFVDIPTVIYFGCSSIIAVFLVRYLLVPVIPGYFHFGSFSISKNKLLMLVFALLMLAAAISMLSPKVKRKPGLPGKTTSIQPLLWQGVLVGIVTGLLGAGGGFLIIPALVLFRKLPMKMAVGTSLAIIAINSLVGFATSLSHTSIQWPMLLLFTAIAVIGIFVGNGLSNKIQGETLKKGFGWFVFIMALTIFYLEIF